MDNIEQKEVPYAERKLTELLDFACDQLYPTTGYRLELDGITSDLSTLKWLEAVSGYSLDTKSGAKIEFLFDAKSNQLVLDTFRQPLKDQQALSLAIQRTQSPDSKLQYISFLETTDDILPDPLNPTHAPILPEDVDRILAGYGVTEVPNPDNDTFILWRAELMSRCKAGWRVFEYAKLLTDFTMNNTETIEISNTQTFSEDGEVSVVKTISKNYELVDDSNHFTQSHSNTAVSIANAYGASFHLRAEVVDKELDPFVLNDSGKIISDKTSPIPLTEDSFNDFKRLLDDSVAYLRASKDI